MLASQENINGFYISIPVPTVVILQYFTKWSDTT